MTVGRSAGGVDESSGPVVQRRGDHVAGPEHVVAVLGLELAGPEGAVAGHVEDAVEPLGHVARQPVGVEQVGLHPLDRVVIETLVPEVERRDAVTFHPALQSWMATSEPTKPDAPVTNACGI